MIHQKLQTVVNAAVNWCEQHNITFDWVCDESDLQGIMLFKKDVKSLHNLFTTITPLLAENDVHFQLQKVRGGNIIVFSLKAISESTMSRILAEMGVKAEKMTLDEKLSIAINSPIQMEQTKDHEQSIDFMASAVKILGENEEAPKKPTCVACNDTGKDSRGRPCTPCQRRKEIRAQTKTKNESYTAKINRTFGIHAKTQDKFGNRLNNVLGVVEEQLNGLATKTGKQPGELFKMFANALRTLGQQMGVGPLQQRLKSQGIKASAARDGLSIILSIENASTGKAQPVARIGYETLESPGDFEKQLKNVLDFSLGEAPGSFDLKQKQIRDQEAAIKGIAKVVAPPNEDEAQVKQMMGGQAPQQATPQAPQQATPQAPQQATPQAPQQATPQTPQRAAQPRAAKQSTIPRQAAAKAASPKAPGRMPRM